VISLNAMGTGWASNDFMQFMTGLGRPVVGFRMLRTMPVMNGGPHITVQQPATTPICYVCGTSRRSVRAMGDRRDLPTRAR
jgi:hypothetical protein